MHRLTAKDLGCMHQMPTHFALGRRTGGFFAEQSRDLSLRAGRDLLRAKFHRQSQRDAYAFE